jgi:hypothetical protein
MRQHNVFCLYVVSGVVRRAVTAKHMNTVGPIPEIFIVSIFQSVGDIQNNWRTVKERLPQSDIWDSHSGVVSCSRLPGSYGVD